MGTRSIFIGGRVGIVQVSISMCSTTYEVNLLYTVAQVALHEMLLRSPYRTLNPEEADLFYVPVYGRKA